MIDLDELERLAKAAATEDDWGYAYDEFTDAWQPAVALELLRELRETREALGEAAAWLRRLQEYYDPEDTENGRADIDRYAALGGEGGK